MWRPLLLIISTWHHTEMTAYNKERVDCNRNCTQPLPDKSNLSVYCNIWSLNLNQHDSSAKNKPAYQLWLFLQQELCLISNCYILEKWQDHNYAVNSEHINSADVIWKCMRALSLESKLPQEGIIWHINISEPLTYTIITLTIVTFLKTQNAFRNTSLSYEQRKKL